MKNYLKNKFLENYKSEPELYLSCGGRFEVLGNHTDHNHGLCIAATCDLSIYAAVKAREDNVVRFLSEGYAYSEIDLTDLDKVEDEVGPVKRTVARKNVKTGFSDESHQILAKQQGKTDQNKNHTSDTKIH